MGLYEILAKVNNLTHLENDIFVDVNKKKYIVTKLGFRSVIENSLSEEKRLLQIELEEQKKKNNILFKEMERLAINSSENKEEDNISKLKEKIKKLNADLNAFKSKPLMQKISETDSQYLDRLVKNIEELKKVNKKHVFRVHFLKLKIKEMKNDEISYNDVTNLVFNKKLFENEISRLMVENENLKIELEKKSYNKP